MSLRLFAMESYEQDSEDWLRIYNIQFVEGEGLILTTPVEDHYCDTQLSNKELWTALQQLTPEQRTFPLFVQRGDERFPVSHIETELEDENGYPCYCIVLCDEGHLTCQALRDDIMGTTVHRICKMFGSMYLDPDIARLVSDTLKS